MAKIPHSPDEIFDEFTKDIKDLFGDDLISILLYGSGAKGEYVYKKSDINFLVVLTEDGILEVRKALDLCKKWNKRNVSVPLFMSREYMDSSLDSFPIEFLNMQKHHKVVYGTDIFESMEISKDDLRLKCEEQIKGKLLHLREEFLRTYGKKEALVTLLSATVPTFASLFTALLALQGIDSPLHKKDILIKTAEEFDLDKAIFEKVISVRESVKLSEGELIQLTENYIIEIRKLAMVIDQWQKV